MNEPTFVIVMGVSGSGKTTVGQLLAAELGCPYFDADDYHPDDNVAKMSRGEPLTDVDRWPWLAIIASLIERQLAARQSGVLACSALKDAYREQLRVNKQVQFVYLRGSFELIYERMETREGHFMGAEMLRSQFDVLEEPTERAAIVVGIEHKPANIVDQIISLL